MAQVAKVSESDADYRKFYVESGATALRLRAETKCAHGQGLAAAAKSQRSRIVMASWDAACATLLCQACVSAEVVPPAQGRSQCLGGLPVCRQGVPWVMLQPSLLVPEHAPLCLPPRPPVLWWHLHLGMVCPLSLDAQGAWGDVTPEVAQALTSTAETSARSVSSSMVYLQHLSTERLEAVLTRLGRCLLALPEAC